MSIRAYIRDRFVGILVGVLSIVLVAWMTAVLGMGMPAVIFMSAVVAAACLVMLVHGYVQRRSFYADLDAATQKLALESRAFVALDLIDRPSFLEGEITYDALRVMGKSMNDEVIAARVLVDEYRSYIETWIHEIKTPIAAARLMAGELRGVESVKLRAEIDRIESYVEQALYYARSTSVEKDFAIREIYLAACVRDAVKKNASFLIGKGVAPTIDVAEDVVVFADVKWLKFVVGQILVNAAKYESTSIMISSRLEGSGTTGAHTVLVVADDGCGIHPSDIDSVFEKGFTGENGRKFGSSTGMGLYLCATMCTEMGLGLSITSERGAGTRVMISFPHDRRRLDILN